MSTDKFIELSWFVHGKVTAPGQDVSYQTVARTPNLDLKSCDATANFARNFSRPKSGGAANSLFRDETSGGYVFCEYRKSAGVEQTHFMEVACAYITLEQLKAVMWHFSRIVFPPPVVYKERLDNLAPLKVETCDAAADDVCLRAAVDGGLSETILAGLRLMFHGKHVVVRTEDQRTGEIVEAILSCLPLNSRGMITFATKFSMDCRKKLPPVGTTITITGDYIELDMSVYGLYLKDSGEPPKGCPPGWIPEKYLSFIDARLKDGLFDGLRAFDKLPAMPMDNLNRFISDYLAIGDALGKYEQKLTIDNDVIASALSVWDEVLKYDKGGVDVVSLMLDEARVRIDKEPTDWLVNAFASNGSDVLWSLANEKFIQEWDMNALRLMKKIINAGSHGSSKARGYVSAAFNGVAASKWDTGLALSTAEYLFGQPEVGLGKVLPGMKSLVIRKLEGEQKKRLFELLMMDKDGRMNPTKKSSANKLYPEIPGVGNDNVWLMHYLKKNHRSFYRMYRPADTDTKLDSVDPGLSDFYFKSILEIEKYFPDFYNDKMLKEFAKNWDDGELARHPAFIELMKKKQPPAPPPKPAGLSKKDASKPEMPPSDFSNPEEFTAFLEIYTENPHDVIANYLYEHIAYTKQIIGKDLTNFLSNFRTSAFANHKVDAFFVLLALLWWHGNNEKELRTFMRQELQRFMNPRLFVTIKMKVNDGYVFNGRVKTDIIKNLENFYSDFVANQQAMEEPDVNIAEDDTKPSIFKNTMRGQTKNTPETVQGNKLYAPNTVSLNKINSKREWLKTNGMKLALATIVMSAALCVVLEYKYQLFTNFFRAKKPTAAVEAGDASKSLAEVKKLPFAEIFALHGYSSLSSGRVYAGEYFTVNGRPQGPFYWPKDGAQIALSGNAVVLSSNLLVIINKADIGKFEISENGVPCNSKVLTEDDIRAPLVEYKASDQEKRIQIVLPGKDGDYFMALLKTDMKELSLLLQIKKEDLNNVINGNIIPQNQSQLLISRYDNKVDDGVKALLDEKAPGWDKPISPDGQARYREKLKAILKDKKMWDGEYLKVEALKQ